MSQPAIDWNALALRLSRPWWGKMNPKAYVYRSGPGEFSGTGKIVGQNYGVWNLTLMARGSYDNPSDHEGHLRMFAQFQQAKKVGNIRIDGQPLESYAMLLRPVEFHEWLGTLTHKQMPRAFCQPIRQAMTIFLEQTKEQRV